MIRHNILRYLKPICTRQVQHLPLERDQGKHAVKARLTIGCHEGEFGVEVVSIPYFSSEASGGDAVGGGEGDIITCYLERGVVGGRDFGRVVG